MNMIVIIISVLCFLSFTLALICLTQKVDIEELKKDLRRARNMYEEECDRNIEKLREDIFRDDLEILKK